MDLEKYIDYTLLKPDTTADNVRQLCSEALDVGFCAVCIPPIFVPEAFQALQGSSVKIATVVGFPLGYSATVAKVEEVKRAIDEGVHELDMVINLAAVKSQNWNFVRNDIDRVVTSVHLKGKLIKVILETALLTDAELERLGQICNELGVDFVKTSTGYNGSGATVAVVQKLRALMKPSIKIKASGGIRTAKAAKALIEAGADRIGTSAGMQIVRGQVA